VFGLEQAAGGADLGSGNLVRLCLLRAAGAVHGGADGGERAEEQRAEAGK
jgi:hypothetical protein